MVLEAPKEKISLEEEEPRGITPWFQYPTTLPWTVSVLTNLKIWAWFSICKNWRFSLEEWPHEASGLAGKGSEGMFRLIPSAQSIALDKTNLFCSPWLSGQKEGRKGRLRGRDRGKGKK